MPARILRTYSEQKRGLEVCDHPGDAGACTRIILDRLNNHRRSARQLLRAARPLPLRAVLASRATRFHSTVRRSNFPSTLPSVLSTTFHRRSFGRRALPRQRFGIECGLGLDYFPQVRCKSFNFQNRSSRLIHSAIHEELMISSGSGRAQLLSSLVRAASNVFREVLRY
jgi:hypothetical protein